MNATKTIRTFLEFFGDLGHRVIPGSSLVPPDGDQVLFTTAGMHPLTRYLEGRPHPQGRRLAGVQRCLRTTQLGPGRALTEADLRYLHQTHGLPPELVTDLLN
jgi:alanyl-tRNA synthetase